MSTTIRPPSAYATALSASFAIGLGISISNGAYSIPAAICVAIAIGLLGKRWLTQIRGAKPRESDRDFRAVLLFAACGAFALAWVAINDERLVLGATRPWRITETSLVALAAIVTTYVTAILRGTVEADWFRNARFVLISACVLTGGIDAIRSSPHPDVDVFNVEQQGADVLARGENPFTHLSVQNTAPGHVGPNLPYVYTPVQLFVTLPAKKIAGDVRYAMLVSILIAGAAMRSLARTALPSTTSFAEDAPALFYFLTPKLFFVIEQAWTEPISVMFASLAVLAHVRKKPVLAAILFGLLFATKQTMIFMVPIAWLVIGLRPWQAAAAIATAGATALPFAFVNFHAFKYALFDFQNLLPPRKDGLTLHTAVAELFGFELPGALGFLLATAASGISAWRLRAKLGEFAPASAFTLLIFFFFNKWAFANYYFLTMGLASLAAAVPDDISRGRDSLRSEIALKIPSESASAI
jgi:hypothetical protein